MKNRSLLLAVSFAALLACSACSSSSTAPATDTKAAAVSTKPIPVVFKKAPAAVQKTLTDNAGGLKIHGLAKCTKDGVVEYKGHVTKTDGSKTYITVAEDGKLLSTKTVTPAGKAVKAAAKAAAPAKK